MLKDVHLFDRYILSYFDTFAFAHLKNYNENLINNKSYKK
jgi:hypothetical protein